MRRKGPHKQPRKTTMERERPPRADQEQAAAEFTGNYAARRADLIRDVEVDDMYDMANEPQAVKEIIYRAILESTWLHTRKFRRRPRNAYASCAAVLEAVELGEFNIVHELLKVSAIYLLSPPPL